MIPPCIGAHHGAPVLCRAPSLASRVAFDLFAPDRTDVSKGPHGGAGGALLGLLKRRFARARHFKPPASRKDSAGMFVVATGVRGE